MLKLIFRGPVAEFPATFPDRFVPGSTPHREQGLVRVNEPMIEVEHISQIGSVRERRMVHPPILLGLLGDTLALGFGAHSLAGVPEVDREAAGRGIRVDLVPTIVVRKVRRERSCHAVGDHAPIRVFELASHGAGIHFPQASAQKFAAWQAQRDLGLGVQVREPPFLVEREEGVGDALQNAIRAVVRGPLFFRSRRSSASACLRSVISRKTSTTPVRRPSSFLIGAALSSMGRSRPSLAISTV